MVNGTTDTRIFPARLSALPDIVQFITDVCERHGFAAELRSRICVLVEELFTNTVRHGHRRDTDEPVLVALSAATGRVKVTYEDTAPPHDPFAAPPSSSAADGKLGGVGLLLIAGMSRPEYRYAEGKNRVCLVVDTA